MTDLRPRLDFVRSGPPADPRALKPPVVLLHSGGMSGRQWRRFASELSETRDVIVPDFIGYGNSPSWPEDELFHISLDVVALERLLDEVGTPVHLVGHSYGGAIAFFTAFHRPAQVASLAVYEPPLFGALPAKDGPDAVSSEIPVDLEAWLGGFVDYWNAPGAWAAMPDAAKASFRAAGWKLFGEVRSLIRDQTPLATYATLATPALLLHGETSPLAARSLAQKIAEAMPNGRTKTISGAGHMGPITHAAVVNAEIRAHFEAAETA